jgi:hypothetical protein
MLAPSLDVVKRGVVIGSIANLGPGSSGFSRGMNLSRNLGLLATNIRVVRTSQMVLTNPIMTTHVRPLMNSIVDGGYRSTNAQNSKERHCEPSIDTNDG